MTNTVQIIPDSRTSQPAAGSETAAIFSMIERIAAQPDVPVERIEQLFKLYTQMDAERARRAYHAAFAQMQPALPAIERRGKAHNSRYARFEDVVGAVMPVLASNGFGMSFRIHEHPGKVSVTCILSHRDGHSEQTEYAFPYDTSGSKNAIQAIGSATSYGKRYTMNALLGIATKDEDDDGNAAFGAQTISEDQYKVLADLLTETKTAPERFCAHIKVESLSDILASKFDAARGMLLARKAEMAKGQRK